MIQDSIFGLRENLSSWCLYATLMGILTLAAFGNLSTHLFVGDDMEYLQDAAVSQRDFSFVVSPERIYPGRPTFNLYLWVTYRFFEDDPAGYHLLQVWLHFAASLLAAFTIRRVGAPFELSLGGGLLFLMNVAHFRAVHWISATSYVLALLFSLCVVLVFLRGLDSGSRQLTFLAVPLLAVATFAHASAAAIPLVCIFLALHRELPVRRAIVTCLPLILTAVASVAALMILYPYTRQIAISVRAPQPLEIIRNLLWFWSILVIAAHWLPGYFILESPTNWELALGFLFLVGCLLIAARERGSLLVWTVWSIAFTLPFINTATIISRYLYSSSLGFSFILAWVIWTLATRIGRWKRAVAFSALGVAVFLSFVGLRRAEAISLYYAGRKHQADGNYQVCVEQLKRSIGMAPPVLPFDIYLRLTHCALAAGESVEGILEHAATKDPTSPELNMLLGVSAFLRNDPHIQAAGENRIQTAIQTSENDKRLRLNTAVAFNNLAAFYLYGDTQTAINLCYRALAYSSNYSPAMINLASALYERGETEKSIEIFETASKIEPSNWKVRMGLAQAYQRMGWTDKALQAYRQTVSLDPSIMEAHFNLGVHHLQRGKSEEAVEAFRQTLRLSPDFSRARHNLAIALTQSGRFQEAIQAYEAYLEFEPENWKAWESLARSHEGLNEIDEAKIAYRRVILLNPDFLEAHFNLGVHCFNNGEFGEAAESFTQALKLSPGILNARIGLAQSFERLGQRENAIREYRHALLLDPGNYEVSANLQSLLEHEKSR